MNSAGDMTMNTMSHACGGTILVGGAGEQRHHYCDRCRAFAYGDDEVPAGSDERANREAWDAGEEQSPDPVEIADEGTSETAALVTSVYEQGGAWACADGHGQEIAAGLPSREDAERVAAAWARRRAAESP